MFKERTSAMLFLTKNPQGDMSKTYQLLSVIYLLPSHSHYPIYLSHFQYPTDCQNKLAFN